MSPLLIVHQPRLWRTQCWALQHGQRSCSRERRSGYVTCADHACVERFARALYFESSAPGLEGVALPAEGACRACGCTEERACGFGCAWVERDLCSACVPPGLLPKLARLPRAER